MKLLPIPFDGELAKGGLQRFDILAHAGNIVLRSGCAKYGILGLAAEAAPTRTV
jgi:hypothetical protein